MRASRLLAALPGAAALRALTHLSRSQVVVRLAGLASMVALLAVAPTGHELGGLAATVLLSGAVLAAVWPEPAGGPAIVGAVGVYVLLAPQDLTGVRAPAAAALVLAELCCVVLSTGAPPRAPLDPTVIRRYCRRWGQMVALAVLVWAMSLAATTLPGLGPVATLLGAVTALVGLAALAVLVLTTRGED